MMTFRPTKAPPQIKGRWSCRGEWRSGSFAGFVVLDSGPLTTTNFHLVRIAQCLGLVEIVDLDNPADRFGVRDGIGHGIQASQQFQRAPRQSSTEQYLPTQNHVQSKLDSGGNRGMGKRPKRKEGAHPLDLYPGCCSAKTPETLPVNRRLTAH
jgi:hypothetical protein